MAVFLHGYAKYGFVENVLTPDGQIFLAEGENFGVEEAIENPDAEGKVSLRMADGGRVVFPAAGQGFVQPIKIVDPYGLETTIVTTGSGANKTTKITEPGGRYLLVHYNGNGYVTNVSAYDGIAGHAAIQTVRYTWVEKTYQHPAAAEVSSLDDDTDDGGASSSTKRTPRN